MTRPALPSTGGLTPEAKPVAWVCTRRLTGDKRVFDEPVFASNPAYVKAHPEHDWTPLYVHPAVRTQEPNA